MNWTPGGPSRVSATRRPLVRPTVREAAIHPRGEFRLEEHQGRRAELVHDPTGDFTPGLLLSLQEIAYGLKLGTWATGTVFRYGRKYRVVGADGYCYTRYGRRMLLVRSIGR